MTPEEVAKVASDSAAAAAAGVLTGALAKMAEREEKFQKAMDAIRPPMGDFSQGDNGVAGSGVGGKSIVKYITRPDGTHDIKYLTLGSDMKSLGDAIKRAGRSRSKLIGHDEAWEGKTITEGNDPSAGFLVPTEFSAGIWEKVFLDNYWLANAQILPMKTDSISKGQLVQIFGASADYDSGMTVAWEEEGIQATEGPNPTFQLRDFRAKKVRALQKVSREMMDDSPAFMSWLSNKLVTVMDRNINKAVWYGNGSTQPLGFMTAAGTLAPARTTANRFKLADALTMDGGVDEAFGENLTWFMRKATNIQLPQDVDTNGQPKVQTNWLDVAGALSRKRQLLGYPVEITKQAAVLGSRGDVVLADPKAYVIGLRQGVEIEINSDVLWLSDIVCIMARARLDGQPIYPDGFSILAA